MLPFLKKRHETGLITKTRTPDHVDEASDDSGIEACAQELIDAVHSRDVKAVASAIRSAFQILELEPHDEADHSLDDASSYGDE